MNGYAMSRVVLVSVIVILLSMAMMTRLWYLQVFDKDFLQDQGDARTIRMERINAHRGIIQDRYGKPLAVSTPVLSLWANPSEVLKAEKELNPLTDYLEVDLDHFLARLEKAKNKNFVYLRRHLPPAPQGLRGSRAGCLRRLREWPGIRETDE